MRMRNNNLEKTLNNIISIFYHSLVGSVRKVLGLEN